MRPSSRIEAVAPTEAVRLTVGSRIVLHLRSGDRVDGVFESFGWRAAAEYQAAYRRFQDTDPRGGLLPNLGASHMVGESEPLPQAVELLGLDPRGPIIRRGLGVPAIVPFMVLSSLMSHGRRIDSTTLRELSLSGTAPLLTEIRLAESSEGIPLNDVASIERPKMKGQTLEGTAFGLAVDGIIVLLLVTAFKKEGLGIDWGFLPE